MSAPDREPAAEALAAYRRTAESRDGLVRAARAAGMNIRRIALESGISRATIYKILNGEGSAMDRRTIKRRDPADAGTVYDITIWRGSEAVWSDSLKHRAAAEALGDMGVTDAEALIYNAMQSSRPVEF